MYLCTTNIQIAVQLFLCNPHVHLVAAIPTLYNVLDCHYANYYKLNRIYLTSQTCLDLLVLIMTTLE